VVPRDRALFNYLRTTDAGFTENFENTDRAVLRGQIESYAQNNPQVLRRLGIPSANHLDRLTPSQAIQLSSQMAQDMVRYDHASIAKDSNDNYTADALTRQNSADSRPVNQYFGTSHDGTCRNYAEVAQASFAELKSMQNPSTTQLANSYVTMPVSHNHTWNSLYTVQPNGDVMVTQVDPTWNETNQAGTSRGTDFTYGQDGVRDYYRMQHLLAGTGNRPLQEFSSTFDNGEGWSSIANSGTISATEVAAAGGYSALSAAIDTLPEPLRVDAYKQLQSDVQSGLNTWRSSNNRSALATSHPQHN
jgi:hypothetical protein